MRKLDALGFDKYDVITYGDKLRFLKLAVNNYEDIVSIASINGVKSVDFFQEYSLPLDEFVNVDLQAHLEEEYTQSDIVIGIIDGGISDTNSLIILPALEIHPNP